MKIIKKETDGILLLLSFFLFLLPACSPLRSYEATLVLADITAGNTPSRLKASTPPPRRVTVTYTIEGRTYSGDIYQPGNRALAAVVLIPGIAEQGKDDPRLTAFATTLARARFLILIPDLPSMRTLKVRISNIQEIADTVSFLISKTEWTINNRVGIGAFSYGVGPAVLAAMDPTIAQQVDFILGVGGYYDLNSVLTFFTTGYFLENGKWRYMKPNEYGKWVFVLSNIERLNNTNDRRLFKLIATRKLINQQAEIEDLVSHLEFEGQQFYNFVTNTDPNQAQELFACLPLSIRSDVAALNLANKNISQLKARLILVHGHDDNIIPYTESIALARALPPDQTRLFVVGGLLHVDLRPGLLDRWRLWQVVYALLTERDADRNNSDPKSK